MNAHQPPAPLPNELLRQRQLVDQTASMHAALRDRASMISTTITLVLLCGGAISAALAFAGTDTALELVGVSLTRSVWLGIFSVVVFIGTLVELVMDHRGVARQHGSAVRLLADLKSAYRRAEPGSEGDWSPAMVALTTRYDDVMTQIPTIPEARFNALKARHLRKVEISKLLSDTPGLSERQARRRLQVRLRAAGKSPSDTYAHPAE